MPGAAAGSRLPAPPAWPLLEVWHPAAGSLSSETVGAALTWVLALEAAGSRHMAAVPAGGRRGRNCNWGQMMLPLLAW